METIIAAGSQDDHITRDANRFPSVRDGTNNKIVFFKPVDNNLAHQTFLGTGMQKKFDFVTQVFAVISFKASGRTNQVTEVCLGAPSGPPLAMKLSNIPYSELSEKLRIWTVETTGYHVQARTAMYRVNC